MSHATSRAQYNQSAEYHENRAAEYRTLFGTPDSPNHRQWDLSLLNLANQHDRLAAQIRNR